jgi:hypothetical protein
MGCVQAKNNFDPYSLDHKQNHMKNLKLDYQIATCKDPIETHYVLEKELIGSGGYGHVRLGTNKQKKNKVAVKTIKKSQIQSKYQVPF